MSGLKLALLISYITFCVSMLKLDVVYSKMCANNYYSADIY